MARWTPLLVKVLVQWPIPQAIHHSWHSWEQPINHKLGIGCKQHWVWPQPLPQIKYEKKKINFLPWNHAGKMPKLKLGCPQPNFVLSVASPSSKSEEGGRLQGFFKLRVCVSHTFLYPLSISGRNHRLRKPRASVLWWWQWEEVSLCPRQTLAAPTQTFPFLGKVPSWPPKMPWSDFNESLYMWHHWDQTTPLCSVILDTYIWELMPKTCTKPTEQGSLNIPTVPCAPCAWYSGWGKRGRFLGYFSQKTGNL